MGTLSGAPELGDADKPITPQLAPPNMSSSNKHSCTPAR
jgi:hypothetical protein